MKRGKKITTNHYEDACMDGWMNELVFAICS